MNDNTVEQLHRSLVDALRRTRPGALSRPVTVAEIYQDLVPYRTARAEVGFDMNADYEHALLRLLAGEGDFARIEPREVRDKLRMELESANPDVGLFRNYAACDVWVNIDEQQADDAEDEPELASADSWEDEFVGASEEDTDARAIQQALGEVPEPAHAAAVPFEIANEEAEEPQGMETPAHELEIIEENDATSCAFCGADLPAGRMVNFCPYCGTDQSQQPCPSCGEMLDPLWRFCISCGARARPLGDHVN